MVVASSWSWVTRIEVTPSWRCSVLISARMVRRKVASRLDSGSSSSSSWGRLTSARASATRCCWPPESSAGRRSQQLVHLHQARRLLGPPARIGLAALFLNLSGNMMFCSTRHVRIERVGLEHDADVAIARLDLVDHGAIEQQLAAARQIDARKHEQAGRLAAARRTEQGDELAVLDHQIHAGNDHRRRRSSSEMLRNSMRAIGSALDRRRPTSASGISAPRHTCTQARHQIKHADRRNNAKIRRP